MEWMSRVCFQLFPFIWWGVPPLLSCRLRHVSSLPIWEIRPWPLSFWSTLLFTKKKKKQKTCPGLSHVCPQLFSYSWFHAELVSTSLVLFITMIYCPQLMSTCTLRHLSNISLIGLMATITIRNRRAGPWLRKMWITRQLWCVLLWQLGAGVKCRMEK